MKIDKLLSQNRRDFTAIYVCEHCGATKTQSGYDDDRFHAKIIPAMLCETCGKAAPGNYRALATKYRADEII